MRLGRPRGKLLPTKVCTGCKEMLPREAFCKTGKTPNSISAKCRKCKSSEARAWNIKNKDRSNATCLKYKKRNPHIGNAWRNKNREHLNAYMRDWRKSNPDYFFYRGGYRAGKSRPAWAKKHAIDAIYELAKKRTEKTGVIFEVDHIIPIRHPNVCGLHVENNLRVIPRFDNRSKGNRNWQNVQGG